MTGDGRNEWYESAQQRVVVLTFDSPESALAWDEMSDVQAIALLFDPNVATP